MSAHRRAFTLVELLVVVTIIIVLLALLVPALSKAVTQARLAVCAAKLNGVGVGAITYATNFRRTYPHRPAVHESVTRMQMRHLTLPPSASSPKTFDDRPRLRPYMSIKALVCPLPDSSIDLEAPEAFETTVYASYAMWFGWRYDTNGTGDPPPEPGMFKLGDVWEWKGDKFNVLAGDHLSPVGFAFSVYSAHPDGNGIQTLYALHDEAAVGGTRFPNAPTARQTVSDYTAVMNTPMGTFELNFAFDDGSVQRFAGINWTLWRNSGMVNVPMLIEEDITTSGIPGRTVAPKRR